MFSRDIEFGTCCVADICLMTTEIIVCEMLIKLFKLCVYDFPVIYFRFSYVIMVKYYYGIYLWFFVEYIWLS